MMIGISLYFVGGWKAVAHSATRTSHQDQKIPCQDYDNYRILNDVIVGAVADGADVGF